jgi:hypothetical protein
LLNHGERPSEEKEGLMEVVEVEEVETTEEEG